MSPHDLLAHLTTLDLEGEFTLDGEVIHWLWETSPWGEDDDVQDRLSETARDVQDDLREHLPEGWLVEDPWSDNDSVGFTVRRRP